MHKISATIITYNEEENIRSCLESLSWTDEIIIADSGSSDKTVAICKEYTDKVFEHDWLGYGRQKNLCAQKAVHDWILNIDADEVVSTTLQKEIQTLLSSQPQWNAYTILRKNYVNAVWIKHGGWYPDAIVRVYNKKKCTFSDALVHESVITNGSCGILRGHIEHYTYKNLHDYFTRIENYSTLSAREMAKKGKQFHYYDVVFRPPLNFVKNYFIRMGFLDGYYGFILAYGYSVYAFKKYIKLRKQT